MFAFELLIGPYAVAHYRLHHALAEKPEAGSPPPPPLPRLGIYLADTLAEAGSATPLGRLGYVAEKIQDERREADRIKSEQRILAIIGNPPYWRFQGVNTREIVGPFVDDLWNDLKEPVRAAGWSNQLNTFPEFSIAFWRWSIWKMFEAENAPGKGVIAFITNRTFMAGKPYAGLRKLLRERFDRIELIDLRGNIRIGERAGVLNDEGVFSIQVGTAITLAIADGSKEPGTHAEIEYSDCWEHDLFARRAKLDALERHATEGRFELGAKIARGELSDFKPEPFGSFHWPAISMLFTFKNSGIESTRDHLSYDFDLAKLRRKIEEFVHLKKSEADKLYSVTRKGDSGPALARGFIQECVTSVSYRPLDTRVLLNMAEFVDWPRPELQRVWGEENFALFTLPFGTAAGPAAWCHSQLPDRHSFRGSYGGYAFPLHDRRPGHAPVNLRSELIEGLSLTYHSPIEPQAVFDAMLGLLSATSYTLRFAEDLEDVFPHVPFPADKAVFDRAAAIGAKIREVETFARAPESVYLTSAVARVNTTPRGTLAGIGPSDWDEGTLILCEDGSGKVNGIPGEVWTFAVSGYRVLQRWLAGREGLSVDNAFLSELRDITGRINELIHLFAEADLVLRDALTHTLTTRELGLE